MSAIPKIELWSIGRGLSTGMKRVLGAKINSFSISLSDNLFSTSCLIGTTFWFVLGFTFATGFKENNFAFPRWFMIVFGKKNWYGCMKISLTLETTKRFGYLGYSSWIQGKNQKTQRIFDNKNKKKEKVKKRRILRVHKKQRKGRFGNWKRKPRTGSGWE